MKKISIFIISVILIFSISICYAGDSTKNDLDSELEKYNVENQYNSIEKNKMLFIVTSEPTHPKIFKPKRRNFIIILNNKDLNDMRQGFDNVEIIKTDREID